jgi:hypothetical protein
MMLDTVLISDVNASHAKACAVYLAKMARKLALIDSVSGDTLDVDNNLVAILLVLSGDDPSKATRNDCPIKLNEDGTIA